MNNLDKYVQRTKRPTRIEQIQHFLLCIGFEDQQIIQKENETIYFFKNNQTKERINLTIEEV